MIGWPSRGMAANGYQCSRRWADTISRRLPASSRRPCSGSSRAPSGWMMAASMDRFDPVSEPSTAMSVSSLARPSSPSAMRSTTTSAASMVVTSSVVGRRKK